MRWYLENQSWCGAVRDWAGYGGDRLGVLAGAGANRYLTTALHIANAQMAENRGHHFNVAEQQVSRTAIIACLQLAANACNCSDPTPKQAGTALLRFIALAIKY